MKEKVKKRKSGKGLSFYKLRNRWRTMTIKKKITAFTVLVFMIICLSVLFDIWVVRFSLNDYRKIMNDNSAISAVVDALEQETEIFSVYMKGMSNKDSLELDRVCKNTEKAIERLPYDYKKTGARRYAMTWSLKNCYRIYSEKRDNFLKRNEGEGDYINDLYELYDMQQYLQRYGRQLMRYTMDGGNQVYQRKVPSLIRVPVLVMIVGGLLLALMLESAGIMNNTIVSPVMKLVDASKKIAANDYFGQDIEVENQDEIGELVTAFNKMRYATGEYISMLEEKRETLDLFHRENMERLRVENQLEAMKFELLKNQIQPHFLFNTLNVISGMANLEDAEITEKMIKALSSLFRYNLKTQEPEAPLEQELKIARDYMYLQQMRFGERISFDCKCNVDGSKEMIPVFTLQPLIENAIIHGISKKEEGGKIRIRVWRQKGKLWISVGDTGLGMSGEKLKEIREAINQEKSKLTGIGLPNVAMRIKSRHKGSCMDIYSQEGCFTVIRIRI